MKGKVTSQVCLNIYQTQHFEDQYNINSMSCKVVQHDFVNILDLWPWCCELELEIFVNILSACINSSILTMDIEATLYHLRLCIILTLGILAYWNIYILLDTSVNVQLFKQGSRGHSATQYLYLFSCVYISAITL